VVDADLVDQLPKQYPGRSPGEVKREGTAA
jgi:hypothetical protein